VKKIFFVTHLASNQLTWESTKQIIDAVVEESINQHRISVIDFSEIAQLEKQSGKISIVLYTPVLRQYVVKNLKKILYSCDVTYHISIFANLLTQTYHWAPILFELKGEKVQFICACQSARKQAQVLLGKEVDAQVIPYPVKQHFFMGNKLTKRKNNFLFAGRLNGSKGFQATVSSFLQARKINSSIVLHICGGLSTSSELIWEMTDNIYELKNWLDLVLEQNKDCIHYYPKMGEEDFLQLLDKVECLITPSMYHDEDFGLTVAQAVLRNCDVILTNWGGYRDHIQNFDLIPLDVQKTDRGPTFNTRTLRNKILAYNFSEERVSKNSKVGKDKFSAETFYTNLEKVVSESLEATFDLKGLFVEVLAHPLDKKRDESLKLYRDIYEEY
jgi:glycosyltransferase involved in cell wall biosynthesis